ncbi:MAG: 2-hydroxychromene-2-carboxylate isomerase [Rhodospirillales bacterium]|jgi:2-hydroxychromene-2-carboxylate isomerase|nr:2-hydroxychromene-2-carboxylate isomerase [Rhodospirillales bacterium]
MKTADWYFDFISGFAYLQFATLERLKGLEIRFRPVLFAGLLNYHGQLGPAEIPAKRTFTYRQWVWLAERHGIPFRMPPAHPFNPLPPLRLALALDCRRDAIAGIFDYLWAQGGDISDSAAWAGLCRDLGCDPEIADAPAVKATLRQNTEEAVAAGIFGVPTLAIDDGLFWGFDAIDMAADFLADPGLFGRRGFNDLENLAVGQARK